MITRLTMLPVEFPYSSSSSSERNFTVDIPDVCPSCHGKQAPVMVSSHHYKRGEEHVAVCTFICYRCQMPFLSMYSYESAEPLFVAPSRHAPRAFATNIESLSPRFVSVYNQAQQAESDGLDEICGMGYRKALEILVKDYALYLNPTAAESIASEPLSSTIRRLEDPDIRILAERSAWLGNDNVHYHEKFPEYGVSDLKTLIDATALRISLNLTIRDAAAIDRR